MARILVWFIYMSYCHDPYLSKHLFVDSEISDISDAYLRVKELQNAAYMATTPIQSAAPAERHQVNKSCHLVSQLVRFPGPAGVTQLPGFTAKRGAPASVMHRRWIWCTTALQFADASPNAFAVGVPISQSVRLTDCLTSRFSVWAGSGHKCEGSRPNC